MFLSRPFSASIEFWFVTFMSYAKVHLGGNFAPGQEADELRRKW